MNNFNLVKLKDTIVTAIRKEDIELYELHDKGIFFLPELAITYLVGKAILHNAQVIFGCEVAEWTPESRVGTCSGPSDLVLKLSNDKKIIFEFKTRCDSNKYINDIEKLLSIDSTNTLKFFCAIMDCYAGQEMHNNKLICEIEERFGSNISRVTEPKKYFDYFTTKDHAVQYNHKQMSCVIGLWQIS